MPTFTPNTNVEASSAFDIVKPGVYPMLVKDVTEFTAKSGNECLKVQLEFADKSSLTRLDGQPANNPGNIFDNGLVTSPAEKQGKLRSFVEACGKSWGDITNTDDLIGCEVKVNIGLEEYEGVQKNVAKRYVK
jgi:hypothetical protein